MSDDAEKKQQKPQGAIKGDFIFVEGVKICRVTDDGRLEFYDKNKQRSDRRGTSSVVVDAGRLAELASKPDTAEPPASLPAAAPADVLAPEQAERKEDTSN